MGSWRTQGASFLSIGISGGAIFAVFLFLIYCLTPGWLRPPNASQLIGGSLGTALLSAIAASAATHYLARGHHGPGVVAHAAVHGRRGVRLGQQECSPSGL